MATIFSALIYEGALAGIICFFYFYAEPRLSWLSKFVANNLGDYGKLYFFKRSMFSTRTIFTIVFMLPFMEFILGFLLQSSDCSSQSYYFCVGVPDLLKHSLFYDIFYLRVNDTYNGAHWIDYMFLPLLFFFTWYLTKDAFFSAINSAFMVFVHESIWFVVYWFRYYTEYQYEGWANDFAFFLLVTAIGVVTIKKYGKVYNNEFFLTVGLGSYLLFLWFWYFIDDFHVTVINNTHLGDSLKYLVTQWYNEPLANELEVCSWILLFGVFVINTWLLFKPKVKLDDSRKIYWIE